MSIYTVSESDAGLASLIDRVIAGDEVIITRDGQPVVEMRPAPRPNLDARVLAFQRLISHRVAPPPVTPTSVELLNMIYEDPGS
jgi:antitoxin (DNA-binding transcriptional repressor) of toxin-antitoxin stability system